MILEARLRELLQGCDDVYTSLDSVYLPLDQAQVLRTRNLRLIPAEPQRPGGRALVTLFLLDKDCQRSLPREASRFHGTPAERWLFDQPAYGSSSWHCPAWAEVPDQAIGVDEAAWSDLLADCGLQLIELMPGNWKERPGAFFQDVMVLAKQG